MNYSHGVANTREEVEANEKRMEKWINPLESRLPLAPNMRIYCLYGVGKPTERSYWYTYCLSSTNRLRYTEDPFDEGPLADAVGDTQCDCENKTCRIPMDIPFTRVLFFLFQPSDFQPVCIDGAMNAKPDLVCLLGVVSRLTKQEKGVYMGEGDGTVSLLYCS
jgi:hypothetical protein